MITDQIISTHLLPMSLIVIAIGCKGKTGERNREREGGSLYHISRVHVWNVYVTIGQDYNREQTQNTQHTKKTTKNTEHV